MIYIFTRVLGTPSLKNVKISTSSESLASSIPHIILNTFYQVRNNAIYTGERIIHTRIRSPETEFLYYNFQLHISLLKYFKIILIYFGIRFCLFEKEVPSPVDMIYCQFYRLCVDGKEKSHFRYRKLIVPVRFTLRRSPEIRADFKRM